MRGSFVVARVVWAALAVVGCGDNRQLGDGGDGGDDVPDAGVDACDLAWPGLQLGGARDDQIWGMTTDAAHDVYVTGYEDGIVGATNIEPDGNSRGVVIRLDPAGAVRWKTVFDTAGTDAVEDIEIDPASGAGYVVGRTSGAFDGFVNAGQFDGFVAAVDPNGQTAKIHQWGDERPQHPVRLSLGSSRDIAITGFDDEFVVGTAVEARETGFVASFARGATLDSAFTLNSWQKTNDPQSNRRTDVVVDRGDGSVYVTSRITRRNGEGFFVEKLNSDGSQAWRTRIVSGVVEAINAIALSPSGELFITGATFLSMRGQNAGQQDAFVVKLDKSNGAIEWAGQGGSANSDFPTAMAFDAIGNVYVAGVVANSTVDIFAMKFDRGGTLRGVWNAGTPSDDQVTSLVIDGCGRALVGGHSQGALVNGSLGTAGGYDMFIVQAAL